MYRLQYLTYNNSATICNHYVYTYCHVSIDGWLKVLKINVLHIFFYYSKEKCGICDTKCFPWTWDIGTVILLIHLVLSFLQFCKLSLS